MPDGKNFVVAINRADDSCKTLGYNVDDHFRDLTKMIELGSGAKREVIQSNDGKVTEK